MPTSETVDLSTPNGMLTPAIAFLLWGTPTPPHQGPTTLCCSGPTTRSPTVDLNRGTCGGNNKTTTMVRNWGELTILQGGGTIVGFVGDQGSPRITLPPLQHWAPLSGKCRTRLSALHFWVTVWSRVCTCVQGGVGGILQQPAARCLPAGSWLRWVGSTASERVPVASSSRPIRFKPRGDL